MVQFEGLQCPNDPSHPFQHMKTFQTFSSSCIVVTDLAVCVSLSLSLLYRASSWSEGENYSSLCAHFFHWVGLNPSKIAFSDQHVSSCWTGSHSDPNSAESDHYARHGRHSTYGTTNERLLWWMTPVSGKQIHCVLVCVYAWLCAWMTIMPFSCLISAQ